MGIFKIEGEVYKPVKDVDLGPNSCEFYLRANAPLLGAMLLYMLKRNNLIYKLVSFAELEEPPVFVPSQPVEDVKEQEVKYIESDLPPHQQVEQAMDCLPSFSEDTSNHQKFSFHRWTILDYSRAYNSGEVTPHSERFIDAVRESCNPQLHMSFFINYDTEDILKQATESTLRYEQGEPISLLDGVPIAIKDEIDCTPIQLQVIQCPMAFQSCGACWKTNMHELELEQGINPHYGATRNPYNTSKVTGGSSSGSAAVVSAGFVLPLNWTVGMVGILASTVEDAFIVYAAISGETSSHQPTMLLPKVCFPLLKSTNSISNIKLAKYGEWFNDCSDDIKVCCSQALDKLHEHYGWETVEVTVPEIETMRLAHYLTIGAECTTSLSSLLQNVSIEELGWDTRVAFRVYGSFDSMEYLNAQRIRNRQMQFHKKIFEKADVIVTPTTGATAYSIMNDALKTLNKHRILLELDQFVIVSAAFVRYQISGNFLGLPAVTIGYDKLGLPIGLQFIGAALVSGFVHIRLQKPEVYYDLLKKN
ncbi:hypothetical protein AAG906_010584 [Vitis piasezkii]